jgi:CRP/FNR family cyclic AMP-dependent transcriptional regulator
MRLQEELAETNQLEARLLDIAPLDRVGWLASQPEDFRHWAQGVARWKTYSPGQFIYYAGDRSDGLHGLAEGGVDITFPMAGLEPIVVYRAEIGHWIGDNAELAEAPRLVSLMAAAESRMLHLPSRAIQSLLAERPDHWRAFYRLGATNVSLLATLLCEALALTVRARVCRRLLTLAEASQVAAITQDDLARILGVTRSTLRRTLTDLADRGAIKLRYRKLHVLDPAVLAEFQNEQ